MTPNIITHVADSKERSGSAHCENPATDETVEEGFNVFLFKKNIF